jgi:hypothetical protein
MVKMNNKTLKLLNLLAIGYACYLGFILKDFETAYKIGLAVLGIKTLLTYKEGT